MNKVNKHTPGPANYTTPSLLFSGPQYSLTGRNFAFQVGAMDDAFIDLIPGPSDYNPKISLTKDKAPAISLKSRKKSAKSMDSRKDNDSAF
jgi:hypothetical protein